MKGNRDNLTIIFRISPFDHMLRPLTVTVLIRTTTRFNGKIWILSNFSKTYGRDGSNKGHNICFSGGGDCY